MGKELSIKPRCWWQFSDTHRIRSKLRKLRNGGTLHFASGVYVIKKRLNLIAYYVRKGWSEAKSKDR